MYKERRSHKIQMVMEVIFTMTNGKKRVTMNPIQTSKREEKLFKEKEKKKAI